jgi:hypothetical protein
MSGLSVWIYAYKYMNEQFFCGQKPQTVTNEEVKERLHDLYSLQLLRMRETELPRSALHNRLEASRPARMSDGEARAHWFSGIDCGMDNSTYASQFNPDTSYEPAADRPNEEESAAKVRLHKIASTTWNRINSFFHPAETNPRK